MSNTTSEPIGGLPPAGSKRSVADFDYQVKYQRAFEAVLWSLPSVEIYRGRMGTTQALGLKDNDVMAWSAPATPKLETITANSVTPYIVAYADVKQEPVVLEIPPAGPDGSLYGQIVDAWQQTIADVGPSGMDGGKGGKYLVTSPDFKDTAPAGYLHVPSPNYRIEFAFRSVPGAGKTEKEAYAYAQRLKLYNLSQAENPPKQKFADPINDRYPTLPFWDETYFNDLYETFTYEPVRDQDRHILGLLASLGIERGKPFRPDTVTRQAMRQAAIDAWYYLEERFDNLPRDKYFWPDRQYVPLLLPDRNRGFSYEYPECIDIEGRALAYFWCTNMPRQVTDRPAAYYLNAMADNLGRPLEAGRTYQVVVPPDMPVRQFWSLTVYDRATKAFIYTASNRTTLASTNLEKMHKNADGSVTLYIGPKASKDLESNWIPTGGKRPLPCFRFYGGTDALFDKTFKMPDFERVD